MTRIVWLASYPRSGNTWFRYLLCNLLHRKPIFSREVEEFIPSFHKGLRAEHFASREYSIIKSHLRYAEDMPLGNCTEKAIYIYRDPLDVLASNVGYAMRWMRDDAHSPDERRRAILRLAEEFITHRGFLGWKNMGMGSWDENVESWIGRPHDFPVLAIRYEEARLDAAATVDRICTFFQVAPPPGRLVEAIGNSSLESLRNVERKEIENGWPGIFLESRAAGGSGSWRFVGEGRSGGAAALLPPETMERARAVFRPLTERYDRLLRGER